MRHNIAASRLKVGGSLGFLLHLSAHVSMLCLFVFEQNGAMQRLHGGKREMRKGGKSMHVFQQCEITCARVSTGCVRVYLF